MSSSEKTVQYKALEIGDRIQEGDQWLDEYGHWQPYVFLSGVNEVVRYGARARRPIAATQPATYEEVPGSRTTQQAVDQPQPERIAYEELRPGDVIQEGDEWQHESGRWKPFASLDGSCVQVRHTQRVRRPHNITMMLAEFANQAEVLAEVRVDEKRLCDDLNRLRGEYLKLLVERDEARAERDRLQEVVSNLYNEPTARQAQQMLRTWATELDWSAGCFGSVGRDEIDTIQKTLVAVIERIEHMINPEGGADDN